VHGRNTTSLTLTLSAMAIVPVQPIFCQRRIPQRSLMALVGRSSS
jgi:hypothetical protein